MGSHDFLAARVGLTVLWGLVTMRWPNMPLEYFVAGSLFAAAMIVPAVLRVARSTHWQGWAPELAAIFALVGAIVWVEQRPGETGILGWLLIVCFTLLVLVLAARIANPLMVTGPTIYEQIEPAPTSVLPDGRWRFVDFAMAAIPMLREEGEEHGFLLLDLFPAVTQSALDGILVIDGKRLDSWAHPEWIKGEPLIAIAPTEFEEMSIVCSPYSVLDGKNVEVSLASTRAQHRYIDLHFREARAAAKWLKDVWPSKRGFSYANYLALEKERADREAAIDVMPSFTSPAASPPTNVALSPPLSESVEDLVGSSNNLLQLQDAMMPYLGKTLETEGSFVSVSASPGISMLLSRPHHRTMLICAFRDSWRTSLTNFTKGDRVRVRGIIDVPGASRCVVLRECELRED